MQDILFWALTVLLGTISTSSAAVGIRLPVKCLTDPASSRFTVSPNVTIPDADSACFRIQLRNCSKTSGACCTSSDVASFQLTVNSACGAAAIEASLNGAPVPGVTISAPPQGPASSRVLTVPGLNLTASSIATRGAQLCLRVRGDLCNSLLDLIPGGSAWSASLLSSDFKCCPVSKGAKLPPCETCWVWDVLGPDGTAESATWDFLGTQSCLSWMQKDGPNCCERLFSYNDQYFKHLRDTGIIVSGFDKPICSRTSVKLCGKFANELVGQKVALPDPDNYGEDGWPEIGDVRISSLMVDFDFSDDDCPMGLINSTIRSYSVNPKTGALDSRCTPFFTSLPGACGEPQREDQFQYFGPFPAEKCQSEPGATPFKAERYLEASYDGQRYLYCVNINNTTPTRPNSTCGQTTRLDRAAFWLQRDDYFEPPLGAYLVTQVGGNTTTKALATKWLNSKTSTAFYANKIGLDLATVKSSRTQICLAWRHDIDASLSRVSNEKYIWTALYDSSGKCCPTFYTKEF